MKALQVIELKPSYRAKEIKVFPLFNALASIFDISPAIATLPSSGTMSVIFMTDSLILTFLPNIKGVFSFFSSFTVVFSIICGACFDV
jgi:hypothetical protein